MTVPSLFSALREDLALEIAHYHPAAQAGRFLFLFAAALALQMLTHGSIVGWSDLRAAILAALPVAYRQWRKTIPVPIVRRVIDDHEAVITGAPAAE